MGGGYICIALVDFLLFLFCSEMFKERGVGLVKSHRVARAKKWGHVAVYQDRSYVTSVAVSLLNKC